MNKQVKMAEIEVISTCSIKQSSPTRHSLSKLDLTAWDIQLLFLDPVQKGILFYKPESEISSIIDRLKISISRALDFFPPLTGRLVRTKHEDNTVHFSIDCNNAGALFSHARLRGGMSVHDILNPLHIPPITHSFFPLNGVRNSEGVSNPLLGIQVTELENGFFIGCAMNHGIADGTSFWHFFNCWAEITRGLDKISNFPTFERSHLTLPKNGLIRFEEPSENSYNEFSPPPVLERVFHFSKESLSKLKSRVNMEAGTDNISSLQSLLAHIWRGVMRYRALDPDEEVKCTIIIGTRSRLSLGETYFGNGLYFTPVTANNGFLQRNGLGWAALELHKMVIMQTVDEVKRVTEDMVKNPKIFTKGGVFTKNSIAISSSPRHNVYSVDFGWGKPVAVRSGAGSKFDGKITMFPAVEAGGIDVEACLASETMLALGEDVEFMEAVS